jgi:hypothetical protein
LSIVYEVNLKLGNLPITGTVTAISPPPTPAFKSVLSTKGHGPNMGQRAISNFTQVVPLTPDITGVSTTITGSTVAGQSPITIDTFLSGASMQANDGDVLSIIGNLVNAAGPGPVSAPVFVTVAPGVIPCSATPPVVPPVVVAPTVAPQFGTVTAT